jgi:hypothetical protein
MSEPHAASISGQVTTLNETALAIAASCSDVWEIFLDRACWTDNVVRYQTLSGRRGEAGELALVRTDVMGEALDRFERVLLSHPPHRMVIALQAPSARTTAFADYKLAPRRAGCRVSLTLVLAADLPAQTDIAAATAAIAAGTQAKIERDLHRLKAVAEARSGS